MGEERYMGIQGSLLAREADTASRPNDVSETDKSEVPSVEYMYATFCGASSGL